MTRLFLIIQLILGVVQFLTGIVANGIIVIVSGIECIKRKKVTAYDLLLISLGIFRIFLQALILTCHMIFVFTLNIYVEKEAFLFFIFVNEVNLWLATYLCLFYCVKIANIFHPFFLWLKMRISRLVPWLILGSLLFSLALSVCYLLLYWPEAKEEIRRYFSGNLTASNFLSSLFPVPILVVGLIVPLVIFDASLFLMIYSLCRHTRKMKSMATGRDLSTEAHIRAVKSVFSFFILYTSYYMGIIISLSRTSSQNEFFMFICFFVAAEYPSGHSIILILGNPKLKHYARKFLLCAKCLLGGDSTGVYKPNRTCCF
ncbi:taste receptor type 2 member 1 [Monodelphis domestica]|uniref:Taste receptor type 2 n=1 Tax=Monodelphis domestica TaxID=13616 RepID=Q2ABA9_MONDO|nr:taste receptor type 2 member 1 [Monodelphis domestica]BAE80358.1 bitter taste receptor [Monodelphis domestica]